MKVTSMKSLCFSWALALTLIPLGSLAAPSVGQYAFFLTTDEFPSYPEYNGRGSVEVALEDFDQDQNAFLYTLKVTTENYETHHEEWMRKSELLKQEAEIQLLLGQCRDHGGIEEYLKVPAGEFKTCKIQKDTETTMWYGNVPFGIVRILTQNDDLISDEQLAVFRWGTSSK